MEKTVTRKLKQLKQLLAFVLIVVMVTPSVVRAAPPESPFHHHDTGGFYTSILGDMHYEPIYVPDPDIPDPSVIEALLNEQQNLWMQNPTVQDALGFHALVNSLATYSSLQESGRHLIFRQLDISEAAYGVASELFIMMEQDGFSLADSVYLMIIMSGGIFGYIEAQSLLQSIPCNIERNTEIMRFEQFVQHFDVPPLVNERRLINRPLVYTGDFDGETRVSIDIHNFINPDSVRAQHTIISAYSFIESAQMLASAQLENSAQLEYSPTQEYPTWEQPAFTSPSSFSVAFTNTSPGSLHVETTPSRRTPRLGLDNATQTRPWSNRSQQEDLEVIAALSAAFTNENAFEVARQMFVDNRGVAEIQAAFALGAALQVEPQTFMLQPDMYRAESAVMFAEYTGSTAISARSSEFSSGSAFQPNPEPSFDTASFDTFSSGVFSHDPSGLDGLEPTPSPPTPPRAVSNLPPVMAHAFDAQQVLYAINADTEELDHLLTYGMGILGFGATPMSMPSTHFHEDIINNPFGLHFNVEESVSLNTGTVTFRQNVLSLPGRGGFGFNLDLVYNSANADLSRIDRAARYFAYQCNRCGPVNPGSSNAWGEVFCPNCRSELLVICSSCGPNTPHPNGNFWWRFYCSRCSRDLRTTVWMNPPWDRPQHRIFFNDIQERENPHGLGIGWNFDLPYVINSLLYLPGRGSFALSGNAIIDYTLQDMRLVNDPSFVSGTRQSTRRLTFHDGTSYFFDGDNEKSRILGMRDRFGNTIHFEYTSSFNNQLLLSRIIDSNGKIINFQYQLDGNNCTITVTGPDNSSFIINMSRIADIAGHNTQNLFQLNSIQNQVGAITSFTYETVAYYFDWLSKTPHLRNHTLLLRRVNYPSGAQLRFGYGWRTLNLGRNGSRQAHMVVYRYLFNNGREYQRTAFSYHRDPTAFPSHVDRPSDHHTYTTTVTQNNGLSTVYTFNHLHLNTFQLTSNANGVAVSDRTILYNDDRLPRRITYSQVGNWFVRRNARSYYYNQFGQIITAVSSMAQGTTHPQYRTNIIYDNRFGLPLTTTFMPDPNTTIRTVNRLSPDGRSIAATYVYENNVRQSRTDFIHDSFGNIIETREFPSVSSADFITTQITFDRSTMPTSVRTLNVRNAHNVLLGGTGVVENRFTYDNMWRITSATDPMGYTTRWEYDRTGRVTRITHPNGGFETYTYNDQQNILTHRTILGATYTHRFDGLGNLQTITDQNGVAILTNIYDNRMRVIETRNAQGIASSQRTLFAYDIFDRVTEVRRVCPAGTTLHRTTTEYHDVLDAAGNSRVVTTVHGCAVAPSIQTFVQHDRFGRLTQEGTIGGRIFTYTHDIAGRVIREQSLGVDNTFTHGVFGVRSVRNIEGNTSHNTYDSMGRLLTSSDFMGNTQRFTYDVLGRLIRRYTPFEQSGNTTHTTLNAYFHDQNGNITRHYTQTNLPGAANSWSTTHNTFRYNRLMSSQTGNGPLTEYTYDLAGNVLTKRAGGAGATGATTAFTYNNRRQLTQTTDALGQVETFTYDANGLLLTRTDRNGTLFRNTYDHMGRVIQEDAVQNGTVVNRRTSTFTVSGAVRIISNGSHMVINYYDAQGRLHIQTETDGFMRWYHYNTANNLTAVMVYTDWWGPTRTRQTHTTHTYDLAQRIHTTTTNGGLLVTYAYDANSRRIRSTYSNGTVTDYTRNLAGMVTNLVNRHGSTVLSSFAYIYYLDGNTHRVTETMSGVTRVVTYTYDTARRLIREDSRHETTGLGHNLSALSVGLDAETTNEFAAIHEVEAISEAETINEIVLMIDNEPQRITISSQRNISADERDTIAENLNNLIEFFNTADPEMLSRYSPQASIMPASSDVTHSAFGGSSIDQWFVHGNIINSPSWWWDGVSAADVERLEQYLAGYNVFIDYRTADLNLDGTVDAHDLMILQQYIGRHPHPNWWGNVLIYSVFVNEEAAGSIQYSPYPVHMGIGINYHEYMLFLEEMWGWEYDGWAYGMVLYHGVGFENLTVLDWLTPFVQNFIEVVNIYPIPDNHVGAYSFLLGSITLDYTSHVSYRRLPPVVTNVSVRPWNSHPWSSEPVEVRRGESRQFISTVFGTNVPQGVTWSITGNQSADTTINANGLLTVAADETASNIRVWAASTHTPTVAGNFEVRIPAPIPSTVFTREYAFDARGNRTRMTVTGSEVYTVTYSYDLNNRLLQTVRTGSGAETTTFTYDRNGNQLTSTTGGRTETRTYNAFNQLTQVTAPDLAASYLYRADGLRRSKTVNGVVTTHVWDRGQIVLETGANTAVVINWFNRCLGGRLILSPQFGWYLYDARGSVVQRTINQGGILHNYRYSAFGNQITAANGVTSNNPFRFNGEYWDAHRGEYYLRARSFNPRTGRFSSSDPYWGLHNMQFGSSPMMRNGRMMPNRHAIAQSGNLFMFVMHDPVNWTDPTGLWGYRVHFTYTQRWAREAGFSRAQARLIADMNFSVDIARRTGVFNLRNKDTSWHVNTYATGDSRLAHAERMLESAISQWNLANATFDNTMANISGNWVTRRLRTYQATTQRDAQRDLALTALGQGLHALQDVFSHGNIEGHRIFNESTSDALRGRGLLSGFDNIAYNWTDSSQTAVVYSGQSHGDRFFETQAATMEFFERFLEGIGGSL